MPTATIIDQDGTKKVAVADANGLLSMGDAKSLEDALKLARESVDNAAGSIKAQEDQAKRDEEGAKAREKEIKDANAKSDAEAAERAKKVEEATAKPKVQTSGHPDKHEDEHRAARAHK